jgi:hypothetical protein
MFTPSKPTPVHKGPLNKGVFARSLGELVNKALDPVLAKQGFGESELILYWPQIVGERLANVSEPLRLQWPPRGNAKVATKASEPATLIVRVESGFALEMQHLAPVILERVNSRLGWRCIGRLTFRQGPANQLRAQKRKIRPIEPSAHRQAADETQSVENPQLREALTKLGSRIYTENRTKG